MPNPLAGESKKDYISRFMSSGEARSDFPDDKQRLAVAYSMFEKRNAGPFGTKEHPWPKAYKCSFIEPGVVFYQDLGECKVCGDKFTCPPPKDGKPGEGCDTVGEMVLVKQDCLAKMAQSFVGKPVIDRVHKEVSPNTVAEGDADGIVTRVWLDEKSGWWMAEFLVWNPEAQLHCESPAYSVSCAYEPGKVDTDGGEYHSIPYQEEILDGEYTHLALVTNPRYEGARIFVNSKKGGAMSWRFWEKGSRKNAAPIDPSKEMINVDGNEVSLKELYDSLEDAPPKYNDDTVLDTPKGEKTLKELKQSYLNKMARKNAEKTVPGAAGAEAGHKVEKETEAVHSDEAGKGAPGAELADLRHDDAEAAAKKLDKETKETEALELKQKSDEEARKNAADDEAKKAEEKKNADEKAKTELKAAEDAAAKKALENAKKEAGKKSFAELRNAREISGEAVSIQPVAQEDRLAKGRSKYGSGA